MPENNSPLLVLIDGMAIAYRAYFAFIGHPLTNSRGENTSAVYGFVNAILQFLDKHKPDFAAVCFDTPAPTFRHVMYPAYKAQRQAMPEDMRPQIKIIKDITKAYNIPLVELDGFEADDIIGTLSHLAEQNNLETIIITPDKDFCQLVTQHIKLMRPKDSTLMDLLDEDAVVKKYGLKPNQFIDYLALVGDSSDNIPGVRGVGEKTATPLLQQYGDLNGIYQNLEAITKKALKEKLTNERENALLSQKLATIDMKVPLGFGIDTLRYSKLPDFRKLEEMLVDLGFKTLLLKLKAEEKEFLGSEPTPAEITAPSLVEEEVIEQIPVPLEGPIQTIQSTPHNYRTVSSEAELKPLLAQLTKADEFCIDLETTSNRAMSAEIIGMSFSVKKGEAYYIPILLTKGNPIQSESLFAENKHEERIKSSEPNASNTGMLLETLLPKIRPVLENPKIGKIGQNIKYDALILRRHGIHIKPLSFDTMIAASILHGEGMQSMDDLSLRYLKYQPIPLSAIAGKLKKESSHDIMASIPTPILSEYGAEDADITLQLKSALIPEVEKQGLLNLCNSVEFPLIDVLTTVEFNGVKINTVMLAEVSKEMEREAQNLCTQIYEYAGDKFNIDSTKQLGDLLFNKLGLPTIKKTKTGFSTDAGVLEQLKAHHPIAASILEYRQYQKLRSTYVDAIPLLVNKETGLIHTTYNQAVAATGRLSSNDPNLQNIPVRTEMGRGLRKAFVSRFNGGQILSADYSQIELRIMAHVAKDEALLTAFRNKEDIHTQTSAKVFGVKPEDVTRDMRRKAKEINYGIMYGIGAFGLANRLGISREEGSQIIKNYFTAFPTVKHFIDSTIAFAKKTGYVQTLLGRRRYMTNINASNAVVRAQDERAAINMPIQGTAAELLKIAMINIQREIEKRDLKSLMIMQVHDELVFDVYPKENEELAELVKDKMINAIPMDVVIEVDYGFGNTWFDAH
ncbi:MAG: DNA polymerase I [Bacteroidota bacterium]|nr:DNA polymerase I [Bacteroidota bacterium]